MKIYSIMTPFECERCNEKVKNSGGVFSGTRKVTCNNCGMSDKIIKSKQ